MKTFVASVTSNTVHQN